MGVGGASGVPGAKLSCGCGNWGGGGRGAPLTISPRDRLTRFDPMSEGERRGGREEGG